MDKQWFNDEVNKIDVPKEDVSIAIKNGIARVQKEKTTKKIQKRRTITLITAASICIGILGSGFVVPQMNSVLADVPIIGKMYSYFYTDTIGQRLSASALVTELNEEAVSNGISVAMKSVYYDAGKIGVMFKVNNPDAGAKRGVFHKHFTYDFKLADGSREWQIAASRGGRVTDEGWLGTIQINYPDKELPPKTTLPITITSIGETRGLWKFDIPVEQLQNKVIHPGKSISSEDKEHTFNFEKITVGKESVAIDYKVLYPLAGENDLARIEKVVDDKGKELDFQASGIEFGREKVGNQVESDERSIFGGIPGDAEFFTIYPVVRVAEKSSIQMLNRETPFDIKSTRSNVILTVDQLEQKNKKLIMKYTLHNVNTKKISLEELRNFGENMHLIHSSYANKEDVPKGYMIKGSTVKVLDPKKLQFQGTFELGGEYGVDNFSLDNYALKIQLSMFIANKELSPVQINLK
ncbi:DUF4179 domain-containing protein [Bacillus wiedmannii]|uniref:DUF4179 domain-containing protein n=1 Tax=Bacillus wiedmannii TaxID=1890302 RepID=UPI000BF6CFDA|nr:DUF4179 domain-containing protein [Bacillus wiedmannii]PFZ97261.1 hypothetical protein COL78_13670 [Bacillus wiedmannii]